MPEFKIKTEIFEGPLDLLLSLIEKKKLLVNDISLSKVTDDFIKHVEQIPSYSVGDRAQFIVIASTLLLIKSRSLLPTLSLTEDEEQSIKDLEERLQIYQKIKELSSHIKTYFGRNRIHYALDSKSAQVVFSPHSSITIHALAESLKDAIKRLPVKISEPKVTIKKIISLEEMIDRLSVRIKDSLKMSFKDFSGKGGRGGSRVEKVEVIVSFLAMLELVKQGIIDAIQETKDDIRMETTAVGIPRY